MADDRTAAGDNGDLARQPTETGKARLVVDRRVRPTFQFRLALVGINRVKTVGFHALFLSDAVLLVSVA